MPFYRDIYDRSGLRDPIEAEFWRRLLEHGPGPLTKPIQSVEQVREELRERDERCDLAVALTKAGLGQLAQVLLARAAACDDEYATATRQPKLFGTDVWSNRSELRDHQVHSDGASLPLRQVPGSAAEALQHTKARIQLFGQTSTSKPTQDVDPPSVLATAIGHAKPEPVSAPSLIGLSDAVSDRIQAPTARPKRTRRRPPTPRKSRKKKPKLKRLKTISNDRHEAMVTAYLVAQALGHPLNVALDFNPGIDHLDHAARLRFWADLIINIRSYIRSRCDARGMPPSWWPFVFIGVRETKRHNSQNEHFHGLIHVPDDRELRHLRRHLKKMRKKVDRIWCRDIVAKRADDQERIRGRKIGSRLNYLLKAAHRDTRAKYPYMVYKGSGFIAGKRTWISKSLSDPKVVASVEKEVAMLGRLREERRSILIAEILRASAHKPPLPWE